MNGFAVLMIVAVAAVVVPLVAVELFSVGGRRSERSHLRRDRGTSSSWESWFPGDAGGGSSDGGGGGGGD